jgi:hypothetical protein
MFGTRPAYTAYTCSNKADRLETDRMERRQSSTGQVDTKESGYRPGGEYRPSSCEKVERREEIASADRMERRNETVRY